MYRQEEKRNNLKQNVIHKSNKNAKHYQADTEEVNAQKLIWDIT